jgi:hypothetical protein
VSDKVAAFLAMEQGYLTEDWGIVKVLPAIIGLLIYVVLIFGGFRRLEKRESA